MKPIKFLKCVVRGILPFYLFTFLPLSASAQKLPVWQDPGVNQQNREPRRAHFFAFESWQDPGVNQQNREPRRAHFFAFESPEKAVGDKSGSARFLSMEGMWKFCFVKNHQDAPKDFFSLKYDDSKWVDFPVPGLFEINGYGDKIYKNMGYAWCTTFENNPPYIGETNNYTGSYRREFDLPADWKGQEVFFHVGSATSNLSVWVNGKYVGYSEDSKVAAEFNLTKYLKPGKNLIAIAVDLEESGHGEIDPLRVVVLQGEEVLGCILMVLHEAELPHALHREESCRGTLVAHGLVERLEGEEVGTSRLTVLLIHPRILPHRQFLGAGR